MNYEETTPHRARRMGREYVNRYHGQWGDSGRKWLTLAFSRGFQAACEELADHIDELIDDGADGDYDALVAGLDQLLNHIDLREERAA